MTIFLLSQSFNIFSTVLESTVEFFVPYSRIYHVLAGAPGNMIRGFYQEATCSRHFLLGFFGNWWVLWGPEILTILPIWVLIFATRLLL